MQNDSTEISERGRQALRRFHAGFLAARIGEWHYLVALNWLVLVRYESAMALGVVNAARLWPAVIMSIPSGVLADRYDCRKLLAVTYAFTALFTAMVALMFHNDAPLWALAIPVTLREFFSNLETPARNTYLGDICPENLPRALASNATFLNLGRVLGPAAAGWMLAKDGSAGPFAVGVLGFVLCAVITAFFQPAMPAGGAPKKGRTDGAPIGEAVRYVWGEERLRLLIGLMVAPMLLAFPYISMVPLYAKELLHSGPEDIGRLLSLTAVGSLVSSATIIGNSRAVLKGTFQIATLLAFSLSLVAYILSPNFTSAAVFMFIAGAASQAYRTVSRILVQTGVPKALHGRVVSLILMDRGLMPVGALVLGWVADHFGAYQSGLVMGIGSTASTLGFVIFYPQILKMGPAPSPEQDLTALTQSGKVLAPGPN